MEALVLYPAPLHGHLVPIIGLCKNILTLNPSLSIHILINTTPPFNITTTTSNYITTISTSFPSITFHNLPTLSPPPHQAPNVFQILSLNAPNVHQTLLSLSKTHTIQAFILDFFCFQVLNITNAPPQLLNLSTYYFFTCSGSSLALFCYFPNIHHATDKNLKEVNTYINIPGVPPVLSGDMPTPLLERGTQVYESFLQSFYDVSKAKGVIINTFEALEPKSLKAISDGLCTPNYPTPKVHCVGPLVSLPKDTQTRKPFDDECLRWLNLQPRKSVVFLCFGSVGAFSREQLCEIACGLERSGQRFLWIVRNPPLEEESKNLAVACEKDDVDLESLLPEGFLGRTKETGLVVKNWAPQVEVLSHDSVGGFVSHCGWNSVLEAVCAGVAMIAWPLYAEQRYNRVILVEEIGVALWMRESNESGFVSAVEVEERVRELMESEKGEFVRKRVMVAKDEAKAALSREHGSSHVALSEFVRSWTKLN